MFLWLLLHHSYLEEQIMRSRTIGTQGSNVAKDKVSLYIQMSIITIVPQHQPLPHASHKQDQTLITLSQTLSSSIKTTTNTTNNNNTNKTTNNNTNLYLQLHLIIPLSAPLSNTDNPSPLHLSLS